MTKTAVKLLYPWTLDADKLHDPAERIVHGILKDLTDRRGLSQEWGQIEKRLRVDIIDGWLALAKKELGQ